MPKQHFEMMAGSQMSTASRSKTWCIVAAVVIVVIIVIALGVGLGLGLRKKKSASSTGPTTAAPTIPPLPTAPPKAAGPYAQGAVATDAGPCSEIGRDILKQNGSAVDATVASLFCIGVINMHSAGIGGGGFMLVYSKKNKTAHVINFRETAPAKATKAMYVNKTSDASIGPLSAGIPGEVKGAYTAHKKFGNLQWKQLVQPAIDLCRKGFQIGKPLHKAMVGTGKPLIKADPHLRALLMDNNGEFKQIGEVITNPKLAKTLEIIRDDATSFYKGPLAETIAADMKQAGGIVTLEDLKNYKVEEPEPIENRMGGLRWFTVPPPASGAVISLILNIMQGYNLSTDARATDASSALTYHRIVESFKLAYARRAELGDPNFVNISDLVGNLTDPVYAESLRQLIWDNQTHANTSYYGDLSFEEDGGTSHLSVLSPDGDAVSVTSTVNYWLGGKFSSNKTGIIFNDEMDDFSTPGLVNLYGVQPSPSNFIEPGKRPMSSISPVIFTDAITGDVVFVAGASGGTRITTGTALVTMSKLWFGKTLIDAVEEPRIHHQLLPPNVTIENKIPYILPNGIQDGLRSRGHSLTKSSSGCVVQAISKEKDGKIFAKSDPRKHGWAAGF